MATKSAKGPSMIETFQEFKETKNIDRTTLVSVLEESFRNVIAKMFGSDENFDVIVNPDKGDFEIHRNRIVVADGEVKDENKEIALSEAQKIEPDYEVGEEVSEWLDKRMLETAETAANPIAKTVNAELLNQNNKYRYALMKQRYPDVVDSVSWGPFDGSGVLYGETSNGFKEMHNADTAWYKQTMTGAQDSFMSSPVVSQATGKVIVNSIAVARDSSGNPVSMILAAIYVQSVMDKVESCKLVLMAWENLQFFYEPVV